MNYYLQETSKDIHLCWLEHVSLNSENNTNRKAIPRGVSHTPIRVIITK